jgi:hypothetical protein
MAESKYKGLLYSPEVLGGIGLLTSGLSGGNPNQALPSLLQGMKTASLFKNMEDEEEKRQLIDQYADQVPENQKAAFKIAPAKWLETNVFAKASKPTFETFKKGNDIQTINTSTKSGLAKATSLTDNGYTKFTQSVQGGNIGDLSKSGTTSAEKKIMGASQIYDTLDIMDNLYEPEFLTYLGKGKGFVAEAFAKAGQEIPGGLENFMVRKGKWEAANQQFFNAYRKEITGVAAGEKEISFLEQSVPNINDAPQVYKAKVKLQKELTQQIIERNKKFIETGFKETRNEKGEPTGKYKEYLLKNQIKPTKEQVQSITSSLLSLEYDDEKIIFQLNQTFGKGNWEAFVK